MGIKHDLRLAAGSTPVEAPSRSSGIVAVLTVLGDVLVQPVLRIAIAAAAIVPLKTAVIAGRILVMWLAATES